MDDAIEIDNRDDFGLWAIEVAKLIVSEQGFELARASRDGTEDDVRIAGNTLGQAITNALMEVYDGLLEGAPGSIGGAVRQEAWFPSDGSFSITVNHSD